MTWKGPEKIIERIIGKKCDSKKDLIEDAWHQIEGLDGKAEIVRLDRNILRIKTTNSAYLQELSFRREQEMEISYQEVAIGTRRVDFFIEEKVILEIKAVKDLELVHLAQARNYLEAYNLEVGLLINFGANRLQFKRVYNNKKGIK